MHSQGRVEEQALYADVASSRRVLYQLSDVHIHTGVLLWAGRWSFCQISLETAAVFRTVGHIGIDGIDPLKVLR